MKRYDRMIVATQKVLSCLTLCMTNDSNIVVMAVVTT